MNDVASAKRLFSALLSTADVERKKPRLEASRDPITREGMMILFAPNSPLRKILAFKALIALSVLSRQSYSSSILAFKLTSGWGWLYDVSRDKLCEIVETFDTNCFTSLCAKDPFLAHRIKNFVWSESNAVRIDIHIFIRRCISLEHGIDFLNRISKPLDVQRHASFIRLVRCAKCILAAIFRSEVHLAQFIEEFHKSGDHVMRLSMIRSCVIRGLSLETIKRLPINRSLFTLYETIANGSPDILEDLIERKTVKLFDLMAIVSMTRDDISAVLDMLARKLDHSKFALSRTDIYQAIAFYGTVRQMKKFHSRFCITPSMGLINSACMRENCWRYIKYVCQSQKISLTSCKVLMFAGRYDLILKAVEEGYCCPTVACAVACSIECGQLFVHCADRVRMMLMPYTI